MFWEATRVKNTLGENSVTVKRSGGAVKQKLSMFATITELQGLREEQVTQSSPEAGEPRGGETTREKHSERTRFWKRRPGLAAVTDLRDADEWPRVGAATVSPGRVGEEAWEVRGLAGGVEEGRSPGSPVSPLAHTLNKVSCVLDHVVLT